MPHAFTMLFFDKSIRLDVLFVIIFGSLLLIFGVPFLLRRLRRASPGGLLGIIKQADCYVRRKLRRWSWYWLAPAGLVAYPYLYQQIIYWDAFRTSHGDFVQAATAAAAKAVDPVQFYCKILIAAIVFLVVNGLAWAALNVAPVFANWAYGYYTTPRGSMPIVPGFKRTFLDLPGQWRMAFFLFYLSVELAVAVYCLEPAFRMQ